MKELNDIICAYREAVRQNKRTALATVVHVEGSSYRRPGARMLVTEEGEITGAISGGCLEGDALRKAMLAISQQQNKLVTYDTTDEEDFTFGVQLGCNGIVHILFEPIDETKQSNPLRLLEQVLIERKDAVLVTLFSMQESLQLGTSILYKENRSRSNSALPFEDEILIDAQQAMLDKLSYFKVYNYDQQTVNAFIEVIKPPVSLVVVGAGNDAQPLVEMAAMLGWQTTVVDGRQTHATKQRFSKAKEVFVAKPSTLLQRLQTDEQTAFVLMTHNYNYDVQLLELLLSVDCAYIGILGPKKKLHRMLDEISGKGFVITAEQLNKIYGPVGLDIGAETAEEIAVSIVAEIKAVLSNRKGASLKKRELSIHTRNVIQEDE